MSLTAAASTMFLMTNFLMALSLGTQRAQLVQRMGWTWPRPFLARPLFLLFLVWGKTGWLLIMLEGIKEQSLQTLWVRRAAPRRHNKNFRTNQKINWAKFYYSRMVCDVNVPQQLLIRWSSLLGDIYLTSTGGCREIGRTFPGFSVTWESLFIGALMHVNNKNRLVSRTTQH